MTDRQSVTYKNWIAIYCNKTGKFIKTDVWKKYIFPLAYTNRWNWWNNKCSTKSGECTSFQFNWLTQLSWLTQLRCCINISIHNKYKGEKSVNDWLCPVTWCRTDCGQWSRTHIFPVALRTANSHALHPSFQDAADHKAQP